MPGASHRYLTRSLLLVVLLPAELVPEPLETRGLPAAPQVAVESALWAQVTLVDGEMVAGFLRWDRNETAPADVLHGDRDPTEEGLRLRLAFAEISSADRRRSIDLPGVRVTWEEDEDFHVPVRSGIRFGRITRIVPDGPNALVELRDAASVQLRASSTDLGPSLRGLEVETRSGDVRAFEWADLAEVRFLPAPTGLVPSRARLHGTVTTREGLRFTGWVAWDGDAIFESDELEGDDASVRFGDIAVIERAPRGGVVVLASGDTLSLAGIADAGDGNGGIHVSDPALGGVVVGWEAFESVRFHPPEVSAVVFDRGGALTGTVETESGERLAGRIVWGLDESEGWQFLNGSAGGTELDIEFSRIERIDKARGGSGAVVTLRDGRVLELEGSNDVAESNRGIVVIDEEGGEHLVDWAGFRALDLGGR